jgi:dihydrofolate reductase
LAPFKLNSQLKIYKNIYSKKLVLVVKSLILTLSNNNSLGQGTVKPIDWTCQEDKDWFQQVTLDIGIVVIGRTTFNTIGNKPLPGRINYLITSNPKKFERHGNLIPTSIEDFEQLNLNTFCVIGGYKLYEYFWNKVDILYISHHKLVEVEGPKFVPDYTNFKLIDQTESPELIKQTWARK